MHKDFDAARRERQNEPLSFTLAGEQFTCLPILPWVTMENLIRPYQEQGEMGVVLQIGPLMEACLIDEDVERFHAILTRKDDPIDLETVTAIVEWLLESYTGRPTERFSSLPGGQSTTGASLRAVSDSMASALGT